MLRRLRTTRQGTADPWEGPRLASGTMTYTLGNGSRCAQTCRWSGVQSCCRSLQAASSFGQPGGGGRCTDAAPTHLVVGRDRPQELHIVFGVEGRHVLLAGAGGGVKLRGHARSDAGGAEERGVGAAAALKKRGLFVLSCHAIDLHLLLTPYGLQHVVQRQRRSPAWMQTQKTKHKERSPRPAWSAARSAAPASWPCARGGASWDAPGLRWEERDRWGRR